MNEEKFPNENEKKWLASLGLPEGVKERAFQKCVLDSFHCFVIKQTDESIQAEVLVKSFLRETADVVSRHVGGYLKERKNKINHSTSDKDSRQTE